MAIIPQKQLFGWQEIDELGDLERLRLVLEHLPDEPLMRLLEGERGLTSQRLSGARGVELDPGWHRLSARVNRKPSPGACAERAASPGLRF